MKQRFEESVSKNPKVQLKRWKTKDRFGKSTSKNPKVHLKLWKNEGQIRRERVKKPQCALEAMKKRRADSKRACQKTPGSTWNHEIARTFKVSVYITNWPFSGLLIKRSTTARLAFRFSSGFATITSSKVDMYTRASAEIFSSRIGTARLQIQ